MHEFEFIEKITAPFAQSKKVIKGVGDDTAVYQRDSETYSLFTTDALVEGVHFKRKESPTLIGRKALAVNLSDIAAMGGKPEMAVVTIGVSSKTDYTFYKNVYVGMEKLAKEFKVSIVGGDTVKSDKFFINVAVTGKVKKKHCILRSGAKKGDVICVTGLLGGSIKGKHTQFVPRLKEAQHLVKKFKVHAMMDISDGVAGDLPHLLKESRVGATIQTDALPISTKVTVQSKKRRVERALSDGEDFELLFTVPQKEVAAVQKAFNKKKGFPKVTQIGEITGSSKKLVYLNAQGKQEKIKVNGYKQF